jgi:methylmalonyl-CoA/ethylmalonyl-CoA epimerase
LLLRKISHLGIVVKNLQAALNSYSGCLGIQIERITEIPDVRLKIGLLKMGEVEIELLEYGDPELPIAKSLRADRPGLNHLCFEVEGFDKVLTKLKESGFALVEGFPRKGVHGRIAFLIPPHSSEERIEILEVGYRNE